MRGLGLILLGTAALALVACGSEQAGSEQTLESWISAVCEIENTELREATSETKPPPEPGELARSERQAVAELRVSLGQLREIPVPDERRADVERFLELSAAGVERYERALPRLEAASRRLERAMKSVKPENLPPPDPDAQTVAGEIMSQVMAVPAVKEAWEEQQRVWADILSDAADRELEAVAERLGLRRCEEERLAALRLTPAELARCGARGDPVTLAELVEVFRASGISLSISERPCRENDFGAGSDATNHGEPGLDGEEARKRDSREGSVLCGVGEQGAGEKVEVVKYDSDYETHLSVLNVDCSVYPHSRPVYDEQVARVKRALEAVVRSER
jgi:hypothetical protein